MTNEVTFTMSNYTINYEKLKNFSKEYTAFMDKYLNSIRDYKIINDTVVIFKFGDGTEIKTVCNPNDKFDLHEAAKIAICKKKFGGTKEYNNALRNAIRQVDDVTKKKANEIAEEKRIAKRKAKYVERQAKRKEKKRQAQIDIQKEAFLKAMLAYDDIMAERAAVPDENVSSDINE